ncbi:tetratricopeptide repeat protein [Flavobacterium sp. T12S277]|uniref:tetratricopeptide repeat protein n=1 Tax=Flavobacterium sp. T12S277 TaxID=3402752 RepID=UPI003AEB5B88
MNTNNLPKKQFIKRRVLCFSLFILFTLKGLGQEKVQKEINYIRSIRREPDKITVELGNNPQLCYLQVKNNINYTKSDALLKENEQEGYFDYESLFEIEIEKISGNIRSIKPLSKSESSKFGALKPNFSGAVAAVSTSELPEKKYTKALELFNKKQYEASISVINEAIVINTQNPDYHRLKALCLGNLMQYKQSSDEAKFALTMDSGNAELYEVIANNYYFLKDYANAVQNFEKAIQYERENITRIYHNYIRCLIEIPNPQRAIEVYKLYQYRTDNLTRYADDLGNFESDLEFYSGQAYQQLKDWQNALDIYDRLIVMYPDVYGYRAQRGRLFQEKGDFLDSINDFTSALKLDPKESILLINLAQTYQEIKEYKKAEAAYKEYLDKNKGDSVQISNYGYLLLDQGHYQDAQAKFEVSFKIDKKNIDTHIGLILTAYLIGDTKKKNLFIADAKSQFPEIPISPTTLNSLIQTGNYYYSEKIITIWKNAIN